MSGSSATGAELLLVDAEQQPPVRRPRGVAGTPACARTPSRSIRSGSSRSFGPGRSGPGRRDPLDEVLDAVAEGVGAGVAVDARQRGEEVQLALHQAAARASRGHQRRDLAVDLGVHRVAEPQLQPGAEQVAHRGPEVGPPAARGDDVQAEGETAGGELLDLHLEVVEVGAQRAPAVDDQEDVAVPVVGAALRPAACGRSRSSRCRCARKYASRRSTIPVTSARIRRTTSGSERVPTPATCGRPVSGAKVPPPKSSTKNCDSSGVVVSDMLATTVRSSVLLPLRGPPTTATCPAAAAEVDRQGVAALLARPVDGAERDDEAAQRPPVRRHQAERRVAR